MFSSTKYGIVYIKIINEAKSKNRKKLSKNNPKYTYFEEHHIIPKSIDKSLISEETNLVLLTAREHFICHLLIWKHYKKLNDTLNERRMSKAIRTLNNCGKYNSKNYELLKLNLTTSDETKKILSELNKGLKNSFYGKKHTNKSKDKISKAHKNMVGVKDKSGRTFKVSKDNPDYLSGKLVGFTKGTKLSEEHKQKIKDNHKSSNIKYIKIFDDNDNLIFECNEPFSKFCKNYNLKPIKSIINYLYL